MASQSTTMPTPVPSSTSPRKWYSVTIKAAAIAAHNRALVAWSLGKHRVQARNKGLSASVWPEGKPLLPSPAASQ